MILHIMAAIVVGSLIFLLIFFDTVFEWLMTILDPIFKRMEEKEKFELLGEHSGMYQHFLEENDKNIKKI